MLQFREKQGKKVGRNYTVGFFGADCRGQRTEGREQRADDGGQRTDDGSQTTKAGTPFFRFVHHLAQHFADFFAYSK